MKIKAMLLSLFLLAPAISYAGVVGYYKIDKPRVKKMLKAKFAKLPPEKRKMAKFALAMVDKLNINLNLTKDGKAIMDMKMSFMGRTRTKTQKGTWKKTGPKKLALTTKRKDRRTGKVKDAVLTCTHKVKGKLVCWNESKRGRANKMFFLKTAGKPKPAVRKAAPRRAAPKKPAKPAPKPAKPAKPAPKPAKR